MYKDPSHLVQQGTVCVAGAVWCSMSGAEEWSKPPVVQISCSSWYDYKHAQKGCCPMGSCKVEVWAEVLLTAFSSFVISQLSVLLLLEQRHNFVPPQEHSGVLLHQGGCKLPTQRWTCLLSSKHRHHLSQWAAAATPTASRDFNQLTTALQATYLPLAAPLLPASLFPSLLPSWLFPGSRERGRGIIYCVPVENERLLHFNEH